MIVDAKNVMLLKVIDKPFKGSEGTMIPYVSCNLLDEDGNVFEGVSVAPEIKDKLLKTPERTQADGSLEIFNGTTKDGKKFLKMRLLNFSK